MTFGGIPPLFLVGSLGSLVDVVHIFPLGKNVINKALGIPGSGRRGFILWNYSELYYPEVRHELKEAHYCLVSGEPLDQALPEVSWMILKTLGVLVAWHIISLHSPLFPLWLV